MVRRILLIGAAVAWGGLLAAACGVGPGGAVAAGPAAGARLSAYADVARRLYTLEATGTVGRAAARRLARDPRLVAGATGRPAALRAAALHQLFLPHRHVVRLSVQRGSRNLVDVGGRFVVAPMTHALPGTRGATVAASVQDVVGYVKLFHRLTGAGIVVRGRPGHVEARPVSALHVAMPPQGGGAVTVAGSPYAADTFTEPGWAGERLRVTVFVPTPRP